ncbi:pilus protein [Escherichia coli]|uniref:pilus protein n=1 Tax=Escherichia coli TaxID=562 RepID=UPI003D802833
MPGAQATARQRRRDRNGRCKPGGFTHRTVATARNRASGFGGDWQVRQQLPVGVGPDDRKRHKQENNKTDNNQGSSNQSQNRRKKRIIKGKVM